MGEAVLRFILGVSWWTKVRNNLWDNRNKSAKPLINPLFTHLYVALQVIAGAGMDVDFTITSPEGSRLIMESRRSDGVHV